MSSKGPVAVDPGQHQAALLRLARLDMVDLDATLREITEVCAEALGVERVGVWRFVEDGRAIRSDDTFVRTPGEHRGGTVLRADDYPAYFHALASARVIAADDARTDPRTREFRDNYLARTGITSMLDVPIWRRGRMVGIVCHEHVGPTRRWTRAEQDFAAIVAELVARALEAADRREAEDARERLVGELEVAAAQWERVVSAIADAVWVIDADGRVRYANPAAARQLGAPSPEALLGSLDDLAQRADLYAEGSTEPLPVHDWPPLRALRGERVQGARLTLCPRGSGEARVVLVSASVLGSGQVVVTAADITERARFDRLAEEFIAVAAHELKTPVTVVKGSGQMLARMLDVATAEPRVRTLLGSIDRGANRIDRITADLLSLSRLRLGSLRLGQLRPVDLDALVRAVAEEVAASTPTHPIRIHGVGPVWVAGDTNRLAQVLTNLLRNAARYSDDGQPIDIALAATDDDVRLSVRDQGIGIPADRRAHLFERFFRAHAGTDRDRGGLGIGLYLARETILAHGGSITVESEVDVGSTFTVHLPRIPPPEREPSEVP